MSKTVWKGSAQLGPIPPVMVTCGDMEKANIITVGWTGIINTIPPRTYISLRPERYSYGIIKESGEFAINLTTSSLVRHADTLGVYTGRKVDKFKKSGLTKEAASAVACPIIGESPLSLECRVFDVIPLGSHDMFLADIVAVDVDPSLIDKDGKLHLERASLAAFAHGEYYELGRRIGAIGFSVAKKKKGAPYGGKPGTGSGKSAAASGKPGGKTKGGRRTKAK